MSKQALASEQVGLGLKATLVGPGQLWGTPWILLARRAGRIYGCPARPR